MIRHVLRIGTFPVLLVGATALCVRLIGDGVDADIVVGGMSLVVVMTIAALERIIPHVPRYNCSHDDVMLDAGHSLISGIALPELMGVVTFSAAYRLGDGLGVDIWPVSWPWPLQIGLALVVAELGSYWFHRAQHRFDFLWRIHATHHSVLRLYWLNAARFHPIDAVLSYLILMLPLVLLGAPPTTLASVTVFITAHGLLQHSNIDLRHGPLSWLFSTAELHRWHHAPRPVDGNYNYGAVLALWDVVFRTRRLPSQPPPAEIGIASMPNFPQSYWGQLSSPFTWDRIGGRPPSQSGEP